LDKAVCSAPCKVQARVEVGDNVAGGVCLIWTIDELPAGQDCWAAQQRGRFVNRELRFTEEGIYQVWVASDKILSNAMTVEVK
jgi:hypothetical protein